MVDRPRSSLYNTDHIVRPMRERSTGIIAKREGGSMAERPPGRDVAGRLLRRVTGEAGSCVSPCASARYCGKSRS